MKKILLVTLTLASLIITCVYCQKKPPAGPPVVADPPARPDSLELSGYAVHFVQLPFPYAATDSSGQKTRYETAWLVRLDLKGMPAAYGPRPDFFLGDYAIPEYGGTATGIYFRIYDPALLARLNGQEIRYRNENGTLVSLNRKFEVPADWRKMQPEVENKVLGRGQ